MEIKHMMRVAGVLFCCSLIMQVLPATADEPCPLPDVNPAAAELVVLLLDTNHDGQLSLSEIRVVYPDLDPMLLMMVDASHNGRLSPSEVVNAMRLADIDVLSYIDTNGDRLIQYEEVSEYLTPELFLHLNINGNDVIDCEDYAYFMVSPAYGEGQDPCGSADMMPFAAYAILLQLDIDGDGVVSYGEIEPLIGAEYAPLLFGVLDRDDNGSANMDEISALLLDLPFDIVRIIDLDQDGAISPEDVEGVIPAETLSEFDFNGDGVLYCDDLGVFPIDEDWGALPFPAEEMLSLRLLNLLRRLFPILDVNGDNILSYEEIRSRIPLPERLFILLDTDGDGLVSWDEIEEWIDYFTGTSQEIIIDFSREIIGSGVGNFFIPGDPLLIRIAVNKYGMDTLTRFRITEMLPKGWTVGAVYNKGTATVVTAAIAGVNKVTISWEGVPPMFPLDLVYELIPPADATGIVTVLGQAVYSSDTGMHSSGMIPTVLIELLAQDYAHSADSNADWRISLSELLRVIQLYGSGTYHLNPFSEDGYDIGDGATDGPAHSADYLNDWRITLSELIRVVQLYNASSRFYCVAGDTEDGYMPAPF